MECSGQVSIWLGNFKNFSDLEKYVQTRYTKDGDSIDAQFEKDFQIDYYDEDFREINLLEAPQNSFANILQEHSYYKSIVTNYTKLYGDNLDMQYNSIILLYNFKYNSVVQEKKNSKRYIRFIGSVEYDED